MSDTRVLEKQRSHDFLPLLILLTAAVLSGLPTATAGQKDWPVWLGPNHNGSTEATETFEAATGLKVVWEKSIGTGYSGISVLGDRLVTMDSDGVRDYVVCLDASSGEELWRQPIWDAYPGRDGAVDGPVSTPAIHAGKVFALGPWGHLLALDLENGRRVWSTHLEDDLQADRPKWGFTSSPLVLDNRLFLVTGGEAGRALTAFDTSSGEVEWRTGGGITDYQSPLPAKLAGRQQIVYATNQAIRGVDPASGDELWSFDHGGQYFYRRIINPLIIPPDRVFLKHTSMESMLLRIGRDGESFKADKLWTTPQIKLNYNIPVHHQGHIYGHSGRFLTCVNADDGAFAWKSRPPGDGFLILVGGHLVILTKSGSIHVAKASPEAYQEVAALQVFERDVWTPPSFANGLIYGRSYFGKVAAVKAVAAAQLVTSDSPPSSEALDLTIPQSNFAQFVRRVESAGDGEKEALIDGFMKSQKQFPVIEGDRWAHIVYRGQVRDLVLLADMFEAGEQVPMEHIEGTDFYYASFELEPDAWLGYRFLKDFEETLPDPLNPRKTPSIFGGERSELVMPENSSPSHLAEPSGQRGRLESFDLTSRFWAYGSRKVQIYLPRGYDDGDQRYPVLYIHYGSLAIKGGLMTNTLDNLIGKTVRPLIAVFVDRLTPYEYARSERGQHLKMMTEELIPRIDRTYRTLAEPQSRGVLGHLEAGYGAIYTAFKRPDVFGLAAAQSASEVGAGAEELFALIPERGRLDLQLYLDWGRRDYRNPSVGRLTADFNRKLTQLLRDRGYQVSGGEVNAGTDFLSWKLRNDKVLEALFPLKQANGNPPSASGSSQRRRSNADLPHRAQPVQPAEVRRLVSMLGLRRGSAVADVGAGYGPLALQLAPIVGEGG
ncbi:MAG TPA: PQQ-binding-like beta-propeller repeat protein, partial [Acidobacteriota bacterium]|nr:PQQ-binding-like beta-propeller repeat protein [Acidobacteriota bacterium]